MTLIQEDIQENLPQVMSTKEAAQRLNVKLRTIYRYIHRKNNPLPVIYMTNRSIRIPWDQFDIWIKDLEGGEKIEYDT